MDLCSFWSGINMELRINNFSPVGHNLQANTPTRGLRVNTGTIVRHLQMDLPIGLIPSQINIYPVSICMFNRVVHGFPCNMVKMNGTGLFQDIHPLVHAALKPDT